MRCARTWYEPGAIPGMRTRPASSVRAPRGVPTTATCTSGNGLPLTTVTVPSSMPVACALAKPAVTRSEVALADRQRVRTDPQKRFIEPLTWEGESGGSSGRENVGQHLLAQVDQHPVAQKDRQGFRGRTASRRAETDGTRIRRAIEWTASRPRMRTGMAACQSVFLPVNYGAAVAWSHISPPRSTGLADALGR